MKEIFKAKKIDREALAAPRLFLTALCFLLVVVSLGCWEQPVWSRAAEFVGRLRCGMSHSVFE